MQITKGIRSVLNYPSVYSAFQTLMGARGGWQKITKEFLKMKDGETLLDIGCGPADLIDYLPSVRYWGFDISPEYIALARKKYANRGNFYCKFFEAADLERLPKFDVALLSGVLHHLDNAEADSLLALIKLALKSDGKLVTIDPCFAPDQSYIANYLIRNDRGRNVRNKVGYQSLVQKHFANSKVDVVHKTWIPYTHCYTVNRNV